MLQFLYLISALTFVSFATVESVPIPKPYHGLYLSVVQIDHKAVKGEAQILLKVFTDDLESVLRAAYEDQYQLSKPEFFCQANKDLIETYFQTHFACQINTASSKLTFVSATLENEIYWLKFTLDVPIEWDTVKINAPFFTEIFSTQSNIIHVLHGGEKRFARLTKGSAEVVFEF